MAGHTERACMCAYHKFQVHPLVTARHSFCWIHPVSPGLPAVTTEHVAVRAMTPPVNFTTGRLTTATYICIPPQRKQQSPRRSSRGQISNPVSWFPNTGVREPTESGFENCPREEKYLLFMNSETILNFFFVRASWLFTGYNKRIASSKIFRFLNVL